MTEAGTLGPGVLPGLLAGLAERRHRGLLTCSEPAPPPGVRPLSRSLRFVNGALTGASSTVLSERLGETLVRHSLLSLTDLVRATALVTREGRRLGDVCRELGVLDDERLRQGFALHARDVLRKLLSWPGAAFRVEARPPDTGEAQPRRTTGEVALDAARGVTDAAAIRHALGDLARGLRRGPGLAAAERALSPEEAALLARVDGRLTARQVLQGQTGAPERALLGLLCAGLVR